LEDRGADIGKWNIHVGDGQSLRVGDEFLEPKTHGTRRGKQALKNRRDGGEVQDRLVAVENDVTNA
jgi:hypothetical protein